MTQPPISPGSPGHSYKYTRPEQRDPSESQITDSSPTTPRKRRIGVVLLLVAFAVFMMLVGGGAVFLFMRTESPVKAAIKEQVNQVVNTKLRLAYEACGRVGDLDDNDRTLFLDMKGEDFGSGDVTIDDIACILIELDAPSYVTHSMDNTRALDGRQSESWDSFEASWTYHPDQGLDVLIREK